ncbi:hypothetical protein ACHAWF_004629 [Thalassiosira exigua]
MGLSDAEVAEINTFFKNRMAESKKIWATRGREARIAAEAKRAGTWRQMSGLNLIMHELGHSGNKPFAIGFGAVALGTLWLQTKFTDEMRASSLYWSTYHGDGAPKGGH